MTVASQVKQTLASLKSLQSSFNTFAIRTQNQKVKQVLDETNNIISEIKNDIETRVSELEREEEQYKGF